MGFFLNRLIISQTTSHQNSLDSINVNYCWWLDVMHLKEREAPSCWRNIAVTHQQGQTSRDLGSKLLEKLTSSEPLKNIIEIIVFWVTIPCKVKYTRQSSKRTLLLSEQPATVAVYHPHRNSQKHEPKTEVWKVVWLIFLFLTKSWKVEKIKHGATAVTT